MEKVEIANTLQIEAVQIWP